MIQALHSYKEMTVQQLLEKLEDVPQATMYRHLKVLKDADVVEVVAAHKVRGTIENVYAVKRENITLSKQELHDASPEEHLQYFMSYQANLLKEMERFVGRHPQHDIRKKGLSYSQTTLHLSTDEMKQFSTELSELMERYLSLSPSEERQAHTFAMIFIPQN